jgi:hypothetical protein
MSPDRRCDGFLPLAGEHWFGPARPPIGLIAGAGNGAIANVMRAGGHLGVCQRGFPQRQQLVHHRPQLAPGRGGELLDVQGADVIGGHGGGAEGGERQGLLERRHHRHAEVRGWLPTDGPDPANKTPTIKAWAARHRVELCLTPTSTSWADPIEAQVGPLRTFTMANSDYPNHMVLARDMQAYLRWRNANARHPDVILAQRKERARVRSERHQRWGHPHAQAA